MVGRTIYLTLSMESFRVVQNWLAITHRYGPEIQISSNRLCNIGNHGAQIWGFGSLNTIHLCNGNKDKQNAHTIFMCIWCTLTKQRTSCTDLFWDLAIEVGIGVKNELICWFWVFFFVFLFLHNLICLLSPPCNFCLIFKHFPIKKKKNLHFLHPVNPKL